MTPFTLQALQEPASVHVPGIRKQGCGWVVLQGSRAVAAFQNENEARAYMARRNQLMRQTA